MWAQSGFLQTLVEHSDIAFIFVGLVFHHLGWVLIRTQLKRAMKRNCMPEDSTLMGAKICGIC